MVLDAETGEYVPLYNPRLDVWSKHFRWSENTLNILPLTTVGRITIARLRLNREGVVNMRRGLLALGEPHPPAIVEVAE